MWWTLSRGNRPRNLGVGAGTTAHPSTTTVPPCTMELPSCTTLPSSTTFEQLLCVFYTGHFSGTLVFETVACFIATCMPGPPSVFVCTWPSALALYIRSVQTYSHCKYTKSDQLDQEMFDTATSDLCLTLICSLSPNLCWYLGIAEPQTMVCVI